MNSFSKNRNLLVLAAVAALPMFTASGNVNSALIPELWAQESLAILEETMIVAQMVHRDFQNEFAQYGEIVNTRKPENFEANRKTDDDDVTVQAAKSRNIPVALNQHIHVSFTIKDGERTKAFKDLVSYYLEPALIAQASFLDKVVSMQAIQFLRNNAGRLLFGSKTTISDYILESGEVLNNNNAPVNSRNLVVTTRTNTMLNQTELFTSAEKRGDSGNALESAQIGQLHGFNIKFAQNMPNVTASNLDTDITYLVNDSDGLVRGDTVIAVDTGTLTLKVGQWVTLADDDVPQVITAVTNNSSSHATSITVFPGVSHTVANNNVVTAVLPIYVNNASGYDIGYAGKIAWDTSPGSQTPKVGQPVTFVGDSDNIYCIVAVDATNHTIYLDRPLVAAIADDDELFLGPAGSYNWAFLKNALALVIRPLLPPEDGVGAKSAMREHNGFAIRVTMTYDGKAQGHLVTVDCLCGVTVLEPLLGSLLLS